MEYMKKFSPTLSDLNKKIIDSFSPGLIDGMRREEEDFIAMIVESENLTVREQKLLSIQARKRFGSTFGAELYDRAMEKRRIAIIRKHGEVPGF